MGQPDRMSQPSRSVTDPQVSTLRVHLVPAFGDLKLKQITPLAVRAFVTRLSEERSPKTVRNAHALLSNVLRDAVLEGLLLTNPCIGVRLPKDRPYEAAFLSPEQIDRLVEVVPSTTARSCSWLPGPGCAGGSSPGSSDSGWTCSAAGSRSWRRSRTSTAC